MASNLQGPRHCTVGAEEGLTCLCGQVSIDCSGDGLAFIVLLKLILAFHLQRNYLQNVDTYNLKEFKKDIISIRWSPAALSETIQLLEISRQYHKAD